MAYAVVANVQSEFKSRTFGSGTALTSGEVAEFITETENYVNSELAQVYVTPVTNATDISILKTITIWFVKHRVEGVLNLKANSELDGETPENLEKKAQDRLDKIIDKKLLQNTDRNTSNNSGIEDYNAANSIDPMFDITDGGNQADRGLGEVDFW